MIGIKFYHLNNIHNQGKIHGKMWHTEKCRPNYKKQMRHLIIIDPISRAMSPSYLETSLQHFPVKIISKCLNLIHPQHSWLSYQPSIIVVLANIIGQSSVNHVAIRKTSFREQRYMLMKFCVRHFSEHQSAS